MRSGTTVEVIVRLSAQRPAARSMKLKDGRASGGSSLQEGVLLQLGDVSIKLTLGLLFRHQPNRTVWLAGGCKAVQALSVRLCKTTRPARSVEGRASVSWWRLLSVRAILNQLYMLVDFRLTLGAKYHRDEPTVGFRRGWHRLGSIRCL